MFDIFWVHCNWEWLTFLSTLRDYLLHVFFKFSLVSVEGASTLYKDVVLEFRRPYALGGRQIIKCAGRGEDADITTHADIVLVARESRPETIGLHDWALLSGWHFKMWVDVHILNKRLVFKIFYILFTFLSFSHIWWWSMREWLLRWVDSSTIEWTFLMLECVVAGL